MQSSVKITALVVSYNPSLELLYKNIISIKSQVDKIILVDNSDSFSIQEGVANLFKKDEDIIIIQLKKNLGIAYAQNLAIMRAIKENSDFVITFDQDSSVQEGLINCLYEEYNLAKQSLGNKVACIGPSVINERDNVRYEKYFKNSVCLLPTIYSVKSIISSGTLYNTEIFSIVGLNKAEWFIDSIDIEWCYRARYLGYHILMTTKVAMKHNLGAKDISLFFGKSINVGSPIRLYYVYRNWIFSLREPHFPFKYKIKLISMMPIKFLIFSMISPKRKRMSYILKGISDGLKKNHSLNGE
ncbi:glycosyltransferase family 2 protein [Superficieibacter electus]|nr:glycosyltransferase family 2 protein [Superficieibacter electus]